MKKEQEIQAWHVTTDRLRDGRPIPPIGEWLVHDRKPEICEHGFHASRRLRDALSYAPYGSTFVHRVRLSGDVTEQADKLVARRRVIDATYPLTKEIVVKWVEECAAMARWAAASAPQSRYAYAAAYAAAYATNAATARTNMRDVLEARLIALVTGEG